MEEVLYRQKMRVGFRNLFSVILWIVLAIFLVGYRFPWYWPVVAGAFLLWEVWNQYNFQRSEYVLYRDRLALNRGPETVETVPLRGITGVYQGGFRSLVTSPELKKIPAGNIGAVPKLGRNSEIVAVTFLDQGEAKAVLIQPTVTLRLVLEEQVKTGEAGS